jgi:hypothetical protein
MKRIGRIPISPSSKQLKRYFSETSPDEMWRYSFEEKSDKLVKTWGLGSLSFLFIFLGYIAIFLPVFLAIIGVSLPFPVHQAFGLGVLSFVGILIVAAVLGNKFGNKHVGAEAGARFALDTATVLGVILSIMTAYIAYYL